MRTAIRLVALLAAMLLFAAACGGSDDGDDDAFTFDGDGGADGSDGGGGSDDSSDGGDGGDSDDDGSDSGSGGSDGPSGDFMTIFGLPPGDSVETDWAPYDYREDEFGTYESVTFEVTGTDLDTIVAHYQDAVPQMGYVISDPIMLGDSYAFDISDPDNPDATGTIQAGETGDTITVTHQKNIVAPPEPTDGDDGGSATNEGSSVTEGADGDGDEASGALDFDGAAATIDWAALPSTPFFAPANQASDPFFHIHTNPASDGFFFSLEMYLEWGQAWTGETGGFEISCSDPTTSTGICPYFDPDGPGPLPVLGGDFMTTGQIVINRLDADGYDLAVGPVLFSDGTVINPFTMTG